MNDAPEQDGVSATKEDSILTEMARTARSEHVVATTEDGKSVSLQQWIFNNLFLPFAEPVNASLMYAVSFILVWLLLMWLLYRKGIFIKI
jgi:predicted acyltransferase